MKKERGKVREEKKILSKAEKERLAQFEKRSEEMKQQGYTRHELTVSIGAANAFALILLIPLFVGGCGLFYLFHHTLAFARLNMVVFLIAIVLLIVVHELIHGLCWSFFTPHHFQEIRFGVMMPSLTPYCTCLVPLPKGAYIFGAVMPLIVLGIVPMIAAIIIGEPTLLLIGIIMTDSAAGDIMIIWNLLRYKSSASEVIYMDHPTEAGGVVYER